jgi:hypothetical protein
VMQYRRRMWWERYALFPVRTTSTEQLARAATPDDTLPIRNLSSRPIPLDPTKMQSAFKSSA